jgi:hypothetical protein
MLVVTSLTYSWFPFHLEIWVATASMMIAYASAVFAAIPHESVHFRYLLVAAFSPLSLFFSSHSHSLCSLLCSVYSAWCLFIGKNVATNSIFSSTMMAATL